MNKSYLSKIVIILRGYEYEQVKAVAKSLEGTPCNSIEITTNSPNMLNTLSRITEEFPYLNFGAGTVCTMEQAIKVVESGARFILSPITLDKNIIEFCKKNNVIVIPAAMTPSEIYKMFELGADIVKVFPASIVGPKFFKAVQAPLGKLNLMAVGGIDINNAKDFLDNGSSYLGVGSGMFNPKDIVNKNVTRLTKSVIKFIESLED